jgi:hypothetical protein
MLNYLSEAANDEFSRMTLKQTLPLIMYLVLPRLNLNSSKLIFKLGLSPASLPIILSGLLKLNSEACSIVWFESLEDKEKHPLYFRLKKIKYLTEV